MGRLLILAPFVCEHSVGEGHSAFQIVTRLARHHDLTLLTYSLRADPPAREHLPDVRVVEWLDLPLVGRFPRINSQLTPGYLPFFLRARSWLRSNLRRERFDLVHQIAPLALRYPCPAVGLGVPFVVGPLGGSLGAPTVLRTTDRHEPWFRRLRSLDSLRFRFDPWLRATYTRARMLIAVAPYVRDILAQLDLPPVRFLSEAGVERSFARPPRAPGPPRLLFVGRVIWTKGVMYAIRALAQLNDCNVTLDVVGSGEHLEACRTEAQSLGLEGRVRFHGQLPRSDVDHFYRQADLFVFPSFREPSGKAVLEAMSHGLPVLAVNHGGPAAVVDAASGRLVDPAPSDEFTRRLASEIEGLLHDPARLAQLGRGAQEHVESEYTWDRKVDWLCRLYRELS